MAAEAQHEASSCSTAGSEQSDRKKRFNSSDEATSLKPYECRFCPMKFAKSQALGGHMNRHRQEREREQVINARKLLMQQDLSSFLIPGENCPAFTKLSQAQLQRSSSEGSLFGLPLSSTSSYRGALQPNMYNTGLGPPSRSWNLATILENTASSMLDRIAVPHNQCKTAYASPLTDDALSPYMMQDPQSKMPVVHDMILSVPYDKSIQGSLFACESNIQTSERSSDLQSQGQQDHSEEGNIIVGGNASVSPQLIHQDKLVIHHGTGDRKNNQFSQAFVLQPQLIQSQPHFYSYSLSDAARSAAQCTSNPTMDFNVGSSNQVDGMWLLGNVKTGPTLGPLLSSNDGYHNGLDASNPNINDENLTEDNVRQSKMRKWDMASASSDDAAESRIRGHTLSGVTPLQFKAEYTRGPNKVEDRTFIEEPNVD